ncbi:hypothetical protein CAP36_13760 [Chitinophagaceae bacterium IBVUCB2]|nr:hypothetical protein CAP36_13760 [Chitinophagaceae bacterium IBVUCB2]
MLPSALVAQTDSIRIICPLNEAVVVPPPTNVIRYDIEDLCIVLTSIPDSVVKACTNARVTNVVQNPDDNNKWEVVIFCKYKDKEYYFWYTGLESVVVRRHESLKQGQSLGTIKPGGRIEFLMYDFETQVDPTKYLDCKGVLKRGF